MQDQAAIQLAAADIQQFIDRHREPLNSLKWTMAEWESPLTRLSWSPLSEPERAHGDDRECCFRVAQHGGKFLELRISRQRFLGDASCRSSQNCMDSDVCFCL